MRIKLFDYLQAGGGAVAQGPVGSVQLCRILSINKSLQVTPIIIILQSPPRPRPALHCTLTPSQHCEQLSRFLFHFKLCGFLIHNTYMTVIRARCFSVGLNVKSYGKKAGLLRVAVVCHVSSATVSLSSRASNEGSPTFHINPYSHLMFKALLRHYAKQALRGDLHFYLLCLGTSLA